MIIKEYGYQESNTSNPSPIQPASVEDCVIFTFSIILAVRSVIGVVVMKWFKLDGPASEAKKREIQ